MAFAIAMIPLGEPCSPSVADVEAEATARWPGIEVSASPVEGRAELGFRLGQADVIVADMPFAIPWPELEQLAQVSLLWPGAMTALPEHRGHLIVTAGADVEPIRLATLLTQATAAVLATCPTALGVYWGAAPLLVRKDIFLSFATEVLPKGPPLDIWIDFRVGVGGDGATAGFTSGLTSLGHMEFEVPGTDEPPSKLRERLWSLASYVLENGPVIADGDTVGEDSGERIRAVHADSVFGLPGTVIRLEYPGRASSDG